MGAGGESADRQRWAELKDLFGSAVERPRGEWPALVSEVRQRDPELARELRRLLDGHVDSLIHVRAAQLDYLPPGSALGPYVVTGLLGEGGMGQVYRARHERLARDVAIKVLPPELAHDTARRARMEREARAMGMLNHPNVVTVHDIGDHQGAPFIVSELLEGHTLRERVTASAGGRLEPSVAVAIVTSVADALGAAHRHGIVHRDIKPENIFLTHDQRIKVLDFGVAKLVHGEVVSDRTAVGTMIGTLDYMAPEQVRGESPCAQTDVYACGVVLYELLSGARPFSAMSQAALIGAVLHEQPQPLRGVAPSLSALVTQCLAKRADARLADGAELAGALRAVAALAANPAEPTPVDSALSREGRSGKTSDQGHSRWRLATAAAAVMVAAVAMGAVMWRQWPGAPSPDASSEARSPSTAPSDVPVMTPTASAAPASETPRRELFPQTPGTRVPASVAPPRAQPPQAPAAPQDLSRVGEASAPPQPTPPAATVVPTLTGVWTVSEEISEDVRAIGCTATGALQLRLDDGLLDGTLRLKRDCKDGTTRETDSTESTAALSAATNVGDAVSFVTRVTDAGLATSCRYSGHVVGNTKRTMTGEVTCEARSVGVSAVLALRGTWRANLTPP